MSSSNNQSGSSKRSGSQTSNTSGSKPKSSGWKTAGKAAMGVAFVATTICHIRDHLTKKK